LAPKRILITGGAGFIGSELARQAVHAGMHVTVADSLVHGSPENLSDLPEDRVRLVVTDIRDTDRMKSLVADVDIVYHLACLCVRHSLHSPVENHDVNATGTLGLLEVARQIGLKRFVYTSSAEVYGSACFGQVTEDNPMKPTNAYGGAKLAAESYTLVYSLCYGVPGVVLRLFNVYGPRCHHEGDSGEVIPKFLLRALAGKPLVIFGDGTQTRDFNFVEDSARAILSAGLRDEAIGQAINIGSGVETSIATLANKVLATVGGVPVSVIHDAPRPADIARMVADGAKAYQLLGYKPAVSLSEGLRRLMEWYVREQKSSVAERLTQEVLHNWDVRELEAVGTVCKD